MSFISLELDAVIMILLIRIKEIIIQIYTIVYIVYILHINKSVVNV